MIYLRKKSIILLYDDGIGRAPFRWHFDGLPEGKDYHWTGLGACLANNLKLATGFAGGKVAWLPNPKSDVLVPRKALWWSPDINEPIPEAVLAYWPFAMLSTVITPDFQQFQAASPAILLKSGTSPWTVDATYNTASNTIYAVGPGGNGANAVVNTSSGGGGGAGAAVFVSNYNNSWTPGTSTATFQITGGNAGAEGLSTANTTFDSSAFIARAGGAGVNNAKGTGGSGTSSTVPVGGTKHKGGDGGIGQAAINRSGGAGGGAAGTTGDGASGGGASAGGVAGAPGGGGADNGIAGTTATGNTSPGFAGGASGLGGSTGGAGAIMGTSLPTSGTLGAGGGGGAAGNTNNTPTGVHTGADGSSGGTQFDATHGAGGGGGGGGGGSGTFAAAGGKGGNYGGGAGGGGVSGTSFAYSGGTGGDGIVFITWTAAPPATGAWIFPGPF